MTAFPGKNAPLFSVIITCYYEENTIEGFHQRLTETMQAYGASYEIILVNDGSTDGTFEKLRKIYDRDSHVGTVVDFFSNAGQIYAMAAGVQHARGENFIFIDSDLQLDPEDLPRLLDKFREGYDVVSGYRQERHDPLFRKITSAFANPILRRISGKPMRDFGCTFKVYRGALVRAFDFGPEKPWATAYVIAKAGRVADVPVQHHDRAEGKSGWRVMALVSFLMDHMVGLLRQSFQVSFFLCMLLAVVFLLRILLAWTFDFSVLDRVTPGLLLNFQVLSLIVLFAMLCMVGEFSIRSYFIQRRYPGYIEREVLTRNEPA